MESKTLDIVGLKTVGMIDDNIESKTDDRGKKFKFYSFEYWLRKKYKKKSRAKRGSKARQRFMDAARSAWESDRDNVTLSDTLEMRSDLTVIKVDAQKNTFVIGFETAEAAKKAFWHNISGAGKGRVRRRFMYLSDKQKKSLAEYARDKLAADPDFAKDLAKMLQTTEI